MHPVIVEIPTPWGPFPIWSYGVMLGLSLIFAWYFIMYLGEKREGLPKEAMANCFMVTAVFALIFARVLYVVTNLDEFQTAQSLFALRSGGLVAYGGFLGGLLGSWVYLRRKKISLLAWADVAAPTLASGLALTRVGCYLYGCDFGAPLEEGAPELLRKLGTFPRNPEEIGGGSPAFIRHVQEYDLSPLADHSLPVHPTQLYESLFGVLLFGAAMLVWKHRTFRGQVILAVTLAYGVWRFLIEYVRDDPERGIYFGFSTSQWISLLLIPLAAFLYFNLRKQQGNEPLVPTGPGPEPETAPKEEATRPPRKRKKRRKKRA